MKNSCSKQGSVVPLLMIAVGLVGVLWPATGYGQRSARRQSSARSVSVDPNAAGQQDSWASFEVILQRNIFSRQRMPVRQRTQADEVRAPVVTRNPESYYVLKGVVQENDDFIAFIEDTQGGTVLRLRRGDPVARGAIKTLTLDGLEYQMEEKTPVVVRLGCDLEGGAGALTTSQMLDLAAMPTATPGQQPAQTGSTSPSSAAEADIVKRLMEQRKQQLGQ